MSRISVMSGFIAHLVTGYGILCLLAVALGISLALGAH